MEKLNDVQSLFLCVLKSTPEVFKEKFKLITLIKYKSATYNVYAFKPYGRKKLVFFMQAIEDQIDIYVLGVYNCNVLITWLNDFEINQQADIILRKNHLVAL